MPTEKHLTDFLFIDKVFNFRSVLVQDFFLSCLFVQFTPVIAFKLKIGERGTSGQRDKKLSKQGEYTITPNSVTRSRQACAQPFHLVHWRLAMDSCFVLKLVRSHHHGGTQRDWCYGVLGLGLVFPTVREVFRLT